MFHFKLVSQTGTKYDSEVSEVVLPTMDGQIGVLTDHMPLVSVVSNGVISVRINPKDSDRNRIFFATNGGVIEVDNNNLNILVDEADHEDSINEAEAQAAYEKAQKLKAEAKDQVSLESAQKMIDRQSVRLQVASLKRRRHH